MPTTALAPGFADPVHDAQATFRAVMTALAEPGSIRPLAGAPNAPAALGPVMGAIVLALADHDTPVWRDAALAGAAIDGWLAFHTGAPVAATPEAAVFALIGRPAAMPAFDDFALGTDADPSLSATLVLAVEGFDDGPRFRLEGPGIETCRDLRIAGAPADLAARLAADRALFPRGVDLLLAGPTAVVGLPRTTRIREV